MPGRLKNTVGCLLLGLTTLAPLAAQPEEVAPIKTHEGRQIANPEELAPPRTVPLSESLPSVTDPQRAQELLHLDLRTAMGLVLEDMPSLKRITSRIRQAEYRVQEAYSAAYPTLDFSAEYSRVQPPISFPGGPVISPADNYAFRLILNNFK